MAFFMAEQCIGIDFSTDGNEQPATLPSTRTVDRKRSNSSF